MFFLSARDTTPPGVKMNTKTIKPLDDTTCPECGGFAPMVGSLYACDDCDLEITNPNGSIFGWETGIN
jgi:hypothetical protein